MSATNAYLEFLELYDQDPVLFVREVLGGEPDPWQCELMEAVARRERQISVRSGHGVGKSTVLAWIIIWHILTKYPQKTLTTAPTSAQMFDALAAEVFGWVTKLPPLLRDMLHCTTDRIVLISAPAESFVSFATSRAESPEAIAGKHSENMLVVVDEASGVPEAVFEAGAGSMSGHNAVTILAGNPVRSSGTFYDSHNKDRNDWHTIHVSCLDCKRVAKDFIDKAIRKWGEKSNAFRVRVLGEFPLADDDTVIPAELIEAAMNRDVKATNVLPIWGLDVARQGSDSSALAKRKGNVLLEPVQQWHGLETMELVGRIKAIWDVTPFDQRPSDICVDGIGIGAGVEDRLRELGLPARGINVSESPAIKGNYPNLRAELAFTARDWFVGRDVNLCNDGKLAEELKKPKIKFTSTGKTGVESKADMKKRGVASPNLNDAFILTFAVEAIQAAFGSRKSMSWNTPLPSRNLSIV